MELRQLRYFETVAKERNFTRAAERLGIAQPPLSRQIKALEDEMGIVLFDRQTRPVRLTEAGRVFYEQAAQILSSVEQLRESMSRIRSVQQKRFVIGVVGSIMYGEMPRIIRRFRRHNPTIEVELVELITLEQVDALKGGRIDAGLGRVRIDDPAIRREILHNEPLFAALPADHQLARASHPLPIHALTNEVLIVYPSQPRPSYADQVLSHFRDHGSRPARVVEVREVQTALGLVAAQAGVAIVPSSMQHLQRDDLAYRPIAHTDATSPIILSQRLSDDSAEAEQFRTIARTVLGTDPPQK
ncbi:LysR family transcriptional regulator [Altererythrobacter soli]|uniref:LysR family transcriptional regulator n=1 Tax=Croceibacterium soli TaxID=1739690 RepID=A0A6I4UU51_9SPHN|nr:LysR family transcriptional regulator [Croceibacterium soli]